MLKPKKRVSKQQKSDAAKIITGGTKQTLGKRWAQFVMEPRTKLLVGILFALIVTYLIVLANAATSVSIVGYEQKTIYHSPQTPGSTAWTGAWVNPDKSIGVSFFQATGPIPSVLSYDYSATTQTNVYLKSSDGNTFTKYREDSIKTPSGKGPYYSTASTAQATITLTDGTIIRRINAEDSPEGLAGVSPNYATAFIQRLAPGASAWSAPIYLLPPASKTYQISRIQYLNDGRLLATGQSWDAAAGTRNANSIVRMLAMVSSNNGATWTNALTSSTQDTSPFPNEWDAAELPNGNLLAVFRSRPLSGGTTQVRNQAILAKQTNGTFTITNIKAMTQGATAVPHSGHPELLAAKEGAGTANGIVLYFATTGYLYTTDAGATWQPLTGGGAPATNDTYYPKSVQADDGTIYIFGHNMGTGGDAKYGAYDQKINMIKFKLALGGISPLPETTITSGPSSSTTATTANFSFSSSKTGSTFNCKLDGAALAACTSPKAYSGLSIGAHTFSVQASDSSGIDPTPATQAWNVTSEAPPPVASFFVDKDSKGGVCKDTYTAAQAKTITTPWCSLANAITLAPAGSTITVRQAAYPLLTVTNRQASSYTSLQPYASEKPEIKGMTINNSRFLRFTGFKLSDITNLDKSYDIQLINNDVTPYDINASDAGRLLFEGNNIHDHLIRHHPGAVLAAGASAEARADTQAPQPGDITCGAAQYNLISIYPRCGSGFRGSGLTDVTFRNNRFSRLPADGIQFNTGSNIVIEGNIFEKGGAFIDPNEHPDSVQAFRNGSNITFRGNIFDQRSGATHGIIVSDGALTNVTIQDNLFLGAFGMNLNSITGLQITHNTSWESSISAQLRAGIKNAVIKNNVMNKFDVIAGATITQEDYNLVLTASGYTKGSHDLTGTPTFLNKAQPGSHNTAIKEYQLDGTLGVKKADDGKDMGRIFTPIISTGGGGTLPPPVDTTPPETTISSGPSSTTTTTAASFVFASSEPGSTFTCKLDTGAFAACTSPKAYIDLVLGVHNFSVKATDPSGNVDATAATSSWTVTATPPPPVDATLPVTTLTAPLTNTVVIGTTNVTATASDNVGVTKVELYIDNQLVATDVAAPYSYSWDTTTYNNGSHSLATKAYDAASNAAVSPAITVTVANPIPPGPIPGDTDGDGKVDVFDLSRMASNWGRTKATRIQGDLNSDSTVNVFDLSILATNWGRKP